MKITLKEFFVHERRDVTPVKPIGATAWSDPTQQVDVHKFTNKDGVLGIEGIDDPTVKEMFAVDEMGGPGSGRKKGSKNKPKIKQITPGAAVDTSSLPSEDDDIDAMMAGFDDGPKNIDTGFLKQYDKTPFERVPGDDGEDSLDFLDDPGFGAGATLPPRAEKPAAAPPEEEEVPQEDFPDFPDFDAPENEDKEFYFDELEEENPKAAADIASEIGQEAANKARYTFHGKFTFMETQDGKRWKYSDAAGWLPYDDGQSPTGEF